MKACTIELDSKSYYATSSVDKVNQPHDEMEIDYTIIEPKVKELNDLGIDITLQEMADLIESKFLGYPTKASLERNKQGVLIHPKYNVIRYK